MVGRKRKNFVVKKIKSDWKCNIPKAFRNGNYFAVGFKVNNERAVRFRKWANHIVKAISIGFWPWKEDAKSWNNPLQGQSL